MATKRAQPVQDEPSDVSVDELIEGYVTALAAVRAANELLIAARIDLIAGLRARGIDQLRI